MQGIETYNVGSAVYIGQQLHQNLEGKVAFTSRKGHVFCEALQRYNSTVDWARELFKLLRFQQVFLVETEKCFFVLGFMGVTSQVGVVCFFGHLYPALRANPMSHFFGSSFLETRLWSASLEPLIDFLAYLEPKLRAKNQNLAKISAPTNVSLCWITPILYMATTHQQLDLESCWNPL